MAAQKSADKDALPAVAWLCGEERLLVDDAHERLRARVLAVLQAPDFNHDRVSARGLPVDQLVGMCRTLPVMSPRRLVEVRDAELFPTAEHDKLVAYVKEPDPSCTLILVADGKPDMRMKLFKELNTLGVLKLFARPSEREVPAWITQRARKHGIMVDGGAADSLAAAIGADLMLLERALEKLRLVVGEGGVVSEDHVATHVAQTRVETSFRIVDAMSAGKMGEALQITLAVVDAGEPPIRLLGALAWAQRNSIRFLDRLLDGVPLADAARECRMFNAGAAEKRVRRAGRDGLVAGLLALADAERALKSSGGADDEAVLVELLFRLRDAHAGTRPRAA
ncbi:MAG: DNA polymerase III subunit delta [Deltaproteobacteria bacterium]|nr:DNA polymerase III subunit delta [Deltaproteobacteria bacterium]